MIDNVTWDFEVRSLVGIPFIKLVEQPETRLDSDPAPSYQSKGENELVVCHTYSLDSNGNMSGLLTLKMLRPKPFTLKSETLKKLKQLKSQGQLTQTQINSLPDDLQKELQ